MDQPTPLPRKRHHHRHHHHHHPTHLDRSIQSTSNDAVRAKDAAVRSGYYQDPFVSHYLRERTVPVQQQQTSTTSSSASTGPQHHHQHHHRHHSSSRRPPVQPIIKRGTHARVACMDRGIASFLNLFSSKQPSQQQQQQQQQQQSTVQIVILGAGKDTTFCRLQAGLLQTPVLVQHDKSTTAALVPPSLSIRWYEVDHEIIVQEKASILKENPIVFPVRLVGQQDGVFEWQVSQEDHDTTDSSVCWKDTSYHLVSHDLRNDPTHLMEHLVKHCQFDESLPTLFVLECVQMYLPESSSQTLLQCISKLPQSFLVMYEPILGNDPFGNVMETNLMAAGVAHDDSCLVQTRTLQQQLKKLKGGDCGAFAMATGCDMWSAYETIVTPEQRRKANACEFLDELEEWVLIMKHYAFLVATSVTGNDGQSFCAVGKASPIGFSKGRCETV